MPRKPKAYKNLSCKLDSGIAERLETMSKQTGMSKTAIVEHALQMYIEHYNTTGRISP